MSSPTGNSPRPTLSVEARLAVRQRRVIDVGRKTTTASACAAGKSILDEMGRGSSQFLPPVLGPSRREPSAIKVQPARGVACHESDLRIAPVLLDFRAMYGVNQAWAMSERGAATLRQCFDILEQDSVPSDLKATFSSSAIWPLSRLSTNGGQTVLRVSTRHRPSHASCRRASAALRQSSDNALRRVGWAAVSFVGAPVERGRI